MNNENYETNYDDDMGLMSDEDMVLMVNVSAPIEIKNKFVPNKKSIFRRPDFKWPEYKFVQRELNLVPGPPVLMYGDAGVSKTAVCSYLALCIATGTPFFGMPVVKGKVLHLDYEQSEELVEIKYYRLMNGHDLSPEEGTLDFARPSLKVNMEGGEDELKEAVTGYDLVIIDCFRACFEGEENDSGATEQALDVLSRVSNDTKVVFILIHHTGKAGQHSGGTHGRGSSRIGQKASTTFTLDKKKVDGEWIYDFKQGKYRISQWEGLSYKFQDFGDFVDSINQTEAVKMVKVEGLCSGPNSNPLRNKIIYCLKSGSKNGEELQKAVGGSKANYLAERKEMLEKGIIQLTKEGSTNKYSLVEGWEEINPVESEEK